MISGYSDHAANERTFLAWIRTGIAVIAFGLLIERFNQFLLTLAASSVPTELTLCAALVLVVASYSVYLAFA